MRLPLRPAVARFAPLARLAWRAAGGLLALRLLLAAAAGLAPVAVAALTNVLLDRLAAPVRSPVAGLTVLLATAGAVAALVAPAMSYVDAAVDRRLARRMLTGLVDGVNRAQGLASLEDPVLRDRLHIAQQAAQGVPVQLLGGLVATAQSGLMAVGFIATLLTLSWPLTLAVVASAGPGLVAQLWLARRRVGVVNRTARNWRRQLFYLFLLTDLRAAKEVRLFGAGDFLRDRMDREIADAHHEQRCVDVAALRVGGGLSFLTAAVSGLALAIGVARIADGTATVGSLILLTAALIGVQSALTTIVGQLASIHEGLSLLDNYVRVVTAPPDLPQPVHAVPIAPLRNGVQLRDVWFRYDDSHRWVLRGLDLSIPAGRTTAIVGLNGSGKSTVVKLLCRLYDPSSGSIHWDEVDLRAAAPAQLRGHITATFQDFMAYELTAAENIGLGDVTRIGAASDIRAAAQAAQIHDMLERTPAGYDTLLTRAFADGDAPGTGVVLSGGQWQRVALARAMIRESADLVILDEPSSGLDPEAEYEVWQCLRRYRTGRTTLVVSHRLNTVRDADHIVVLADGQVAEEGTHDELMCRNGAYRRLFDRQAAGYRDPVPSGATS